MGASVKLTVNDSDSKQLYWDPTGIAVEAYDASGKLVGMRTLQDDFTWVDCGGFARRLNNNVDAMSAGPEKENTWAWTFGVPFNGTPVVVAGTTATWEYGDCAYGLHAVTNLSANGFTTRMINGSKKGLWNTWIVFAPHWIAVGK